MMSPNLSSFENMSEKDGGVPIHFNNVKGAKIKMKYTRKVMEKFKIHAQLS